MKKELVLQKIQENRNIFDALLKYTRNITDLKRQIPLLKFLAQWAMKEHTGYFSSLELEKMLSAISQKTIINSNKQKFKTNSFLHVMTSAYSIGGHTPLANHWIQQSDADEQHSLVLLNQILPLPSWLENSVKQKDGILYRLDYQADELVRAQKLFEIAMQYEYIVLHVDMHDIIPALTFANTKFNRPIIFINHADHLFWLGASYADMVSELSSDGCDFTHSKRAKLLNQTVTIPTTIKTDALPSKVNALKQLNLTLHDNDRILTSMATPYKFNLFDTYPFIEMALELLKSHPHIYFIVIGPDKDKEAVWQEVYKKTNGKINAVGYKEHDEVLLYKAITDIYIDSFPFSSYTSLLEFASHKIPTFSLKNEMKTLDILKNRPNLCEDIETMLKRITAVLSGMEADKYDLSEAIMQDYSPNKLWRNTKYKLIQATPKSHQLHWDFVTSKAIDSYDLKLYAISNTKKSKPPFFKDIYFKDNIRIASLLYQFNYLSFKQYSIYVLKTIKNYLKRWK